MQYRSSLCLGLLFIHLEGDAPRIAVIVLNNSYEEEEDKEEEDWLSLVLYQRC
jgi:hypothetical protein